MIKGIFVGIGALLVLGANSISWELIGLIIIVITFIMPEFKSKPKKMK